MAELNVQCPGRVRSLKQCHQNQSASCNCLVFCWKGCKGVKDTHIIRLSALSARPLAQGRVRSVELLNDTAFCQPQNWLINSWMKVQWLSGIKMNLYIRLNICLYFICQIFHNFCSHWNSFFVQNLPMFVQLLKWFDIKFTGELCSGESTVVEKVQNKQSAVRREGIIKEFLPGVYPVTNARAWGIYYYYKDQPTWLKEISIYFFEVTRTRTPPYCFECMIALVKADNFTIDIQLSNRNSTSVSERAVIGGFTQGWFYAHRQVFAHCAFPVFIMSYKLY